MDHVDQKNRVQNTDIVESMELENMMSRATQDLNNGETRHESRGNYAHDHEDVPECEEVQWTKHALS